MRKALFARALTLVAALGLLLAFPVSAVADHAGEWIPYDAGEPAHASSIVDPTTVELAIEDPEEAPLGTSVEIADLDHEVESGTTLSFEHTTESGVGCNDSGKNDVRAFVIIDGENTNTWDTGTKCGGTVVIEEGGTITHAGVVMDADQPEPGVVRVSNLTIGEHLVHFTNPPAPEPCEWDDELVADDPECVEPEPEPEPTEDPTSEPSSEPTAEETTPASEDDTTPASTQETLPDTGVSPPLMAGLGLALVLAGGAAMLRRRTE